MKKQTIWIVGTLALLMACACQREVRQPEGTELTPETLVGYMETETKAYLDQLDVKWETGDKISLSQLEKANGGLASLMFLKDSSGLGIAGYGGAFCTFDGFGYVKIYDDVDNKKYIAISNNFKRGTEKGDRADG